MSKKFEKINEIPADAQQAFYDLLLVMADSKHLLGLRYGDWLAAPAIEASISAIAMAQDEFGHARLFLGILNELIEQGYSEREEVPSEYRNCEVLDSKFASWTQFVAANAMVDLALSVQLEAFRDSSYLPMRRMIGKISQEERFHFQHAQGWLLRIARENERAKGEMEKAMKAIWPIVLCWFGSPGSKAEKALLEAGIQDTDSDGLRDRWIERIGPVIEQAQLDLPVSNDSITGQWILGTELAWGEGWDEAFRRFNRTGPDSKTFAQIECFSNHEYPVGSQS